MTLKEFTMSVATGLIGADPETPQKERRSVATSMYRYKVHVPLERPTNKAAHLPIHGTKIRCANCSTKLQPRRSRWRCKTCNVGLCLNDKQNCFLKFHEK